MRASVLALAGIALLLSACADQDDHQPTAAKIDADSLTLRDRGLAALENEQPEQAEQQFRELTTRLPGNALAATNLAVALLRQQRLDEARQTIAELLQSASPPARTVALGAQISQGSGDSTAALDEFERALQLDPEDSEVAYASFNLASQLPGEQAQKLGAKALARLNALRPDNSWVLLKSLQRALGMADRVESTRSYLRLRELAWQFDAVASDLLEKVGAGIAEGKLSEVAAQAQRLENVLRSTDGYREALRDLRIGVLGVPMERFIDEPGAGSFAPPIKPNFSPQTLDTRPGLGSALAAADLDGDGKIDLLRAVAASSSGPAVLETRLADRAYRQPLDTVVEDRDFAERATLLVHDFDNDGPMEVLLFGLAGVAAFSAAADGTLQRLPADAGFGRLVASAAVALDFDIEGDLDIATAADAGLDLLRNNLVDAFESVGAGVFAPISSVRAGVRQLLASDLDRDGDLDLLLSDQRGLRWLDNRRQGEFGDRSERAGLAAMAPVSAVALGDLDNDGWIDLVYVNEGRLRWLRNESAIFDVSKTIEITTIGGETRAIALADFDNDGRTDVATAGSEGLTVHAQKADRSFQTIAITDSPKDLSSLLSADLNGDGKLDLVASGSSGLHLLHNQTQTPYGWLAVRLRGLNLGNSKNNLHGLGAALEVRNGDFYVRQEVTSEITHLGLGTHAGAEVLRVLWTNGVPQNRLQLDRDQTIVEEQLLKGSCPFLYAWNGERFAFVTDLLWGAPLGLPVAPGVWLPADPSELVRVDGLVEQDARYQLRITEELWEAAFFDHLKLWVVDHPGEVEVASNLRIVPGRSFGESVLASRNLRPMRQVLDGRGVDVSATVAERDEVYADGYGKGPYQGIADQPWTFTMDLGAAPGTPIRLHLEGWVFPADASLNLAVAQRPDIPYLPPRIEVETSAGWKILLENAGFPPGKTKAIVIDLPALPAGATRIRMVTNLWLHWDRIRWTSEPADTEFVMRAQLLPNQAQLRSRGFSQIVRPAPNGPHYYDYDQVSQQSPWLSFPGRYTRFGDVLPLLLEAEDYSVILAAGDELVLSFDASRLPALQPGHRRTLFLESHGWDKDADRNTYAGEQLEPLPFRAMSGYPGKAGEEFPDSPGHRAYREDWLTREVR